MFGVYAVNAEGYGRLIFSHHEEDRAYLYAYNTIIVQRELYTLVNLHFLPDGISHLDMLRLAGTRKAKYLHNELREVRQGFEPCGKI